MKFSRCQLQVSNMSLFKALLLVALTLLMFLPETPQGQGPGMKCLYAVGNYRNCTCGVKYRIVEKRCCSSEECLQPVLSTENLTCPFVCENGGTYDSNKKMCLCPPGHYGLCCEQATPFCGEVHLKHTGIISSLNFPQEYPNNVKCIWKISTDPNRRIAIGVKDMEFDVEPGSNIYSCNYDFVSVSDGTDSNAKCLGTFCGMSSFKRFFQTTFSSGPNLYVQFSSDFIVRKKGFQLLFSVFFAGQECGPFSTYSRTKGKITSPHYPLPYRPNENCQWTIKLKEGNDVILTFEVIDIVGTVDCKYGDYLMVSLRNGKELKHVTAFCGRMIPESYRVLAVEGYKEVVLTFKSDRSRQGMGFVLRYRQVSSEINGSA